MYRRTRFKVCGITNEKDAMAAVENGADALGFIFVESSPRYIAPEEARKITKKIPAFVQIVGVFMDHDPVELEEIIEYSRLTCVQLHGRETPDYCRLLGKAVPPCKIVKAFRVGSGFDHDQLTAYKKYVSGILLDTYVKGQEGGTGKVFDWSLITDDNLRSQLILAGGISPDNVTQAITTVRPFSLDVSSGVEMSPGKKDHAKIKEFAAKVREADGL